MLASLESVPLVLRVGIVVAMLGAVIAHAAWQSPPNVRRIQELAFMAIASTLAACFAVVHDAVTYQLSREYFALGKGLGPDVMFFPDVMSLAIQASWWVGLLLGFALLIANNPSPRWPQLRYRHLLAMARFPAAGAMLCATVGFATASAWHPWLVAPYADLLSNPRTFEQVWCIHIGTYGGAFFGGIASLAAVRRTRRQPRGTESLFQS